MAIRKGKCTLSQKAYQESLPKKRMGAGCLFFDGARQLLLVKPSYKPTWEIPGGVVEKNESPRACCQREVLEEIGLDREIGKLLVVDYTAETPDKTEALMFIFLGGLLTDGEIAQIRLAPDELVEFGFFTQSTLPDTMTETLRQRVLVAWRQVDQDGALYVEEQI